MLDSRQTLTTLIENNPDLTALGVTVVQEDGFTADTEKPTIVIVYDGSDEEGDTLFRNERWDFWLAVESGDYYTLGKVGQTLRKALDRTTPVHLSGAESTVVRIRWGGEGPAVLDTAYRVHTQIQSYIVMVFDISG